MRGGDGVPGDIAKGFVAVAVEVGAKGLTVSLNGLKSASVRDFLELLLLPSSSESDSYALLLRFVPVTDEAV